MVFEKRKYTRYLVQADTYAAFGPHFTKVGKTIDISIGGLAFEYINGTQEPTPPSNKVTLFLTRGNFILWNLPCRLVYDIPKTDYSYNPAVSTHYECLRCGLSFNELNDDHRQNLEYFFEHHTRGMPEYPNYMSTNS
jgi:hypothetical protein